MNDFQRLASRYSLNFLGKWWIAIGILGVFSVGLRGILIMAAGGSAASGPDGPSYHESAIALLQGLDDKDVWQLRVFPKGYSLFVALVYSQAGIGSVTVVLILQSLILMGSIMFLSYSVKISLGAIPAIILFAGLSLSPASLESSTSMMYEGLLISASAVILGATIQYQLVSRNYHWLIPLGVAAFIGVGLHPRFILVNLAVVVGVLFWGRKGALLAAMLVVTGSVALLALLTWNASTQGVLTLSSNQGSNLAIGLGSTGQEYCAQRVYEPTDWAIATPEGDSELARCARDWIADHPIQWASQIPGKAYGHFEPASIRAATQIGVPNFAITIVVFVSILWTALLTVGAIYGSWTLIQSKRFLGPLVLACWTVVSLPLLLSTLFFSQQRFSYSSLPFLFLLVSVGSARALALARPRFSSGTN